MKSCTFKTILNFKKPDNKLLHKYQLASYALTTNVTDFIFAISLSDVIRFCNFLQQT